MRPYRLRLRLSLVGERREATVLMVLLSPPRNTGVLRCLGVSFFQNAVVDSAFRSLGRRGFFALDYRTVPRAVVARPTCRPNLPRTSRWDNPRSTLSFA